MAYSHKNSRGQEYFLHTKEVTLKGGRIQRIYYFARAVNEETALNEVPAAYVVSENARTGLPLLKKSK
jgi:hypothetical protein